MPVVTTDTEIRGVEWDAKRSGWIVSCTEYTTTEPTFWERLNPFSKVQREVDQKDVQYFSGTGIVWHKLPDFQPLNVIGKLSYRLEAAVDRMKASFLYDGYDRYGTLKK